MAATQTRQRPSESDRVRIGCEVRLLDHAPSGLAGRVGEVVGRLAASAGQAGRWQIRLLADPWTEPALVEVRDDEIGPAEAAGPRVGSPRRRPSGTRLAL